MHIKTDDKVQVISGGDRGHTGKVIAIDREAGKLTVEGANKVYKHVRRSAKNPQGGRLNREMPISISNVLLVCPQCGKPTRTGGRLTADGVKERYCKKCDAGIGTIAPARTKK
ncbi:MAG: 50S ribosomal protein L24 [Planctomycetota bacterium]